MTRASAGERPGWEGYLFGPVDATAAAAFRIGLACMCAIVFWPADLLLSREVSVYPFVADLYPSLFKTAPWHWLQLGGLALFGLGLRPRWVGPVLVLCLFPGCFEIGPRRSRQILLFALLAFSLVASDTRRFPIPWRPAGRVHRSAGPIWPIRLIQLQLALCYAVNAVAKLTPEYLDGSVLILLSEQRSNFLVDLSDGNLYLGPLVVPTWLCAVGTVLVESALAVGFWFRRTRLATAAMGVAFHMGLKLIVAIGFLDWASMFLYSAFLLPFETHHEVHKSAAVGSSGGARGRPRRRKRRRRRGTPGR